MAYKKKRTAVYVPSEIMEEVKILASQEERSIAKMTEILLKEALRIHKIVDGEY